MTRPPDEAFAALPADWAAVLSEHGVAGHLATLATFVAEQRRFGPVYPSARDVFRAFELTQFEAVRAVIVGQDPYHREGQAHGLAFSVPTGVRVPPSLRNIFIELEREYGMPLPANGALDRWANRGVLLLNRVLTVGSTPGSHRGRGWEAFTAWVVSAVNDKPGPVAFFLWGRAAQSAEAFIDPAKHVVVRAGHPSPLSARHFRGRAGFAYANSALVARGADPIEWSLG